MNLAAKSQPASQQDFILHLNVFEGPLDLLLYLIEKNRFTLESIDVCPIIEQYLEYIENIRSLNISLAGEFLEMASYLIWLKSCLLLPGTGEDEQDDKINPAEELKEMLIAYRAIKLASSDLRDRPILFMDKFPRGEPQGGKKLPEIGIGALLEAINTIRKRTRLYVMETHSTPFGIREMMARIWRMLGENKKIALNDVIDSRTKTEYIGTLMAALEMSKASLARLMQKELFAKIYIVKR